MVDSSVEWCGCSGSMRFPVRDGLRFNVYGVCDEQCFQSSGEGARLTGIGNVTEVFF